MSGELHTTKKGANHVGIRRSARRDAIVAVLERSVSAMTPEEILLEAVKEIPGLGIATVYRNLKLLLDSVLVQQLILPDGQSRFELAAKTHHHHFQCRACGKAYCLDGCALSRAPSANLPKGFMVDGHEITYLGLCSLCNPDAG